MAATFADVRLVQQPNRGLSAARNSGLKASSGTFIVFLDADDRLLPRAIEAGRDALITRPDAAFAFGRFRYIDDSDCRFPSALRGDRPEDAYAALLRGNFIAMHATVIYRRDLVAAAGGFDETLRACEDYDLYFRLAQQRPVVGHDEMIAEYRRHDANMSQNSLRMLSTSLAVMDKQRPFLNSADRQRAYADGRRGWVRRYAPGLLRDIRSAISRRDWQHGLTLAVAYGRLAGWQALPIAAQKIAGRGARRHLRPGRVRWESLRRTRPVSESFGFDRGQPVDRYYIDRFLREFAGDVRGRTLEIGDDAYTRALSNGRVTQSDILHVDASNPRATIVGDLAHADHIPPDTFDCIILTQTLHLLYDLEAAARTLHRILKPGGVLLATVPGITPLSADRWAQTWYWSLTELSARRLFESVFGREVVTHAAGNVLSATAFLYGLAAEEMTAEELDAVDVRYPVTIGIRATK